jgi:glycine/D-amino acid oxidase-like deaminating enzyme
MGGKRLATEKTPVRSWWLEQALAADPGESCPPLAGSTRADVCIVGGGYTGLWTALTLAEREPALELVVLEADVCGAGASGRNGGFAMTMVERNIAQLRRRVGPEQARAQHLAIVDTLREIQDFARTEGIDADITNPGLLTVSNGPEQDIRIQRDIDALPKHPLLPAGLEEALGHLARRPPMSSSRTASAPWSRSDSSLGSPPPRTPWW